MNKLVVFAAMAPYLLAACSGGSGDASTTEPDASVMSSGGVELGLVKGASVAIQTLGGYTLVNSTTDDRGFFEINATDLEDIIDSLGLSPKFVKIISTGGIDTDPNDDGIVIESEQIAVRGSVSGIMPLQTVLESSGYRINLISTALTALLDGQDDESVSSAQIAYIVERLGVPDINNDGVTDIDDLADYRMVDDESKAEVSLRESFLEYIHEGDALAQKLFAETLKYEVGFTRPLVTQENGGYTVNLSKTDIQNDIYYGVVTDQSEPEYLLYNGESLNLAYNTAVFFQECSSEFGCYKLQKLFFYQNAYFADHDFEPVSDSFDDIPGIVVDLEDARINYESASMDREQTDEEIRQLQIEIDILQDKVNSI